MGVVGAAAEEVRAKVAMPDGAVDGPAWVSSLVAEVTMPDGTVRGEVRNNGGVSNPETCPDSDQEPSSADPLLETAVPRHRPPKDLSKYAWLSMGAAVATIVLKVVAWWLSGSVGLLSDAAESLVNLVAAIVALIALKLSITPPNERFNYGRSKAEYFSAITEGVLIFLAAAAILYSGVKRFIHPQPLDNVGVSLLVSAVASVLNGAVAWVLLTRGRKEHSATLTADGKHLLTDVWTSVGVIVGVGLVWVSKWDRFDALVAIAVGVNILVTGYKLIASSGAALMDVSLPEEDRRQIEGFMRGYCGAEVKFHAIRTREAGYRRFVDFHMLVPGEWTVRHGHDVMEDLIDAMLAKWPDLRVMGHLEPADDPRSYEDLDV